MGQRVKALELLAAAARLRPSLELRNEAIVAPGASSRSQVAFPYQTNLNHVFLNVPASGGLKFRRLIRL